MRSGGDFPRTTTPRRIRRSRESLFKRHSLSQSLTNRRSGCAKPTRPFRQRKSFAIEREKAHDASILVLLSPCCPSAIFFAVRAIIVDPINRVRSRWFPSHVGEKSRKRIQPYLTNNNTASAIISESRMLRMMTARCHIDPRAVFIRFRKPMIGTHFPHSVGGGFAIKASATFGVISSEIGPANDPFDAAFTSTKERTHCAEFAAIGNDAPSVEALSR